MRYNNGVTPNTRVLVLMLCAFQGETVVDLGSGAGFDAFLAASRVGPTGHVYGVDMNKASDTAYFCSGVGLS